MDANQPVPPQESDLSASATPATPQITVNRFQSASEATLHILNLASYLSQQKQALSLEDYKKLLQQEGWEREYRLYLKVDRIFNNFSRQDLAQIEPDTLLQLARHNRKYATVIEQLQKGAVMSQESVRSLMKKCEKPRKKRQGSSSKGTNLETHSAEEKLYTEEEVQKRIEGAFLDELRKMKESNDGKFWEIRNAAFESASDEVLAYRNVADSLRAEKEELRNQINVVQEQLAQAQVLVEENQKLSQQVLDLQSALDCAVTANQPVASPVQAQTTNSEIVKDADRLEQALKEKDEQLSELKLLVEKQEEEINHLQEYSGDIIAMEFSAVASEVGLSGWNSRGYRDTTQKFFTGLNAIAAYVRDFYSSDEYRYQSAYS